MDQFEPRTRTLSMVFDDRKRIRPVEIPLQQYRWLFQWDLLGIRVTSADHVGQLVGTQETTQHDAM